MAIAVALDRGRESYRRQAWTDAYESLSAADRSDALGAEDLELLATCAYMIGREEDYFGLLGAGAPCPPGRRRARWPLCAARSGSAPTSPAVATWVVPAAGSHGRSGCSTREQGERVEQGYMLIPLAVPASRQAGDLDAAAATAGEAAAIGAHFGDSDLFALAAP